MNPDLVLVDLRMPEMDGMEVLKWIRKNSPDTPVLIMSGTGILRDAVEALRLGAWNYLLKPIEDMTVLLHAVRIALERACLIHENRLYQEHLEEEVNRRTRELEETTLELKRSEEKYRSIYENLQDVYFESLVDGSICEVSPSVKNFSHYTPEELHSMSLWERYENPLQRKQLIDMLVNSGKVEDFEVYLKDRDGTILPCSVNAVLIRDAKGEPEKICGTIRNISERKHAEEEHQKLLEQLYQAQKMEALGSLTGGIAHDFNNILTVINGHAEIALKKLQKELPIIKDINAILQAGKRAENLTKQLLAFSRKQIHKPRAININEVIMEAKQMLLRIIGEDINVQFHFGKEIPPIQADPVQIEQILMNLVVNARDALNEKKDNHLGKKIIIETEKFYLDSYFTVDHPGSISGMHVLFAVSDNGVGIPYEIRKKIFDPFYTTKEKGKGTGLGLSTVYGIVKQNNGSIYVYSEPEHGTTFKIYWPASEESLIAISQDSISSPSPVSTGNETILLAEDDDDVRAFAKETLKDLGYNVIEAINGKKALELFHSRSTEVNLLLTDLVMPEMNGKDLAANILKINPEIVIIYATGYTDNYLIHGYEWGENVHYIQKPYSSDMLARKIREALDKK